MYEVLKFIIKCIVQFCAMLFTIDIGFTSLGTFMCIIFIFLPIVLAFVNFLKGALISELDNRYDSIYGHGDSFFGNRYIGKHEYRPKHGRYR